MRLDGKLFEGLKIYFLSLSFERGSAIVNLYIGHAIYFEMFFF
jgi:hypothetical protein